MLAKKWSNRTVIYCCSECKMVQLLWKRVWQFLTKLNTLLPYDPALVFLGVESSELKTLYPYKTCRWMFIRTSFTNCQNQSGWTHTLTHPYETVLCSTKRKALSSHKKTQRKFKWILLNERSQYENAMQYMIQTNSHKSQNCGESKTISSFQGQGVGRDE